MGRERGNRQSDVALEEVQCLHQGALSPTAQVEERRTSAHRARPLNSPCWAWAAPVTLLEQRNAMGLPPVHRAHPSSVLPTGAGYHDPGGVVLASGGKCEFAAVRRLWLDLHQTSRSRGLETMFIAA